MGKNYRNCTLFIIKIHRHITLLVGLMKKKGSIFNYNWSENMVSRIKRKYGEHIYYYPISERQPENYLLFNKKIQEDSFKGPLF